MNILITTGIYPPKIGGPSQYAKNLKEAFEKGGHEVLVRTFGLENYLLTGVRHLFFFIKILPSVLWSNVVIILDTFSVGLPTVLACKMFGKKSIIRTGGDFLWEQYVERTGKNVLFRNFYKNEIANFSKKEEVIFKLTKWTLKNATKVVFSTNWQRDIFVPAYGLDIESTSIIENYYGSKEGDLESDPKSKVFVASARNLKWKNMDILRQVFISRESKIPKDVDLLTKGYKFTDFIKVIKESYAVILVSLGDISPNIILDAIRCNKPFICTREIGIMDRIKEVGIFVDPLNKKEIEEAVLNLLTKENYDMAREKVRNFHFLHTWDDIAREFVQIYTLLK